MDFKAPKTAVAAGALGLLAVAGTAQQPVSTPTPTYDVTVLATGLVQPKGLDAPLYRAGGGSMVHTVFVAESGQDRIVSVSPDGTIEVMCDTLGDFPVGLGCDAGRYGPYMYIGGALGGGLERVGRDGVSTPFALGGMDVAGMDFGHGDFGNFLYVGEWQTGNVWKVDPQGNATLFASIPGESRYLAFSNGGSFGQFLYVTDFQSGDIYRVDPLGVPTLFASTGSSGIEGLAFSPGGVWGDYLYVGNLSTGELLQVAPDGTVTTFMGGFPGVADILFKPGGRGGFEMYMVDGVSSVYLIRRI